jgi:hypothetical protein
MRRNIFKNILLSNWLKEYIVFGVFRITICFEGKGGEGLNCNMKQRRLLKTQKQNIGASDFVSEDEMVVLTTFHIHS